MKNTQLTYRFLHNITLWSLISFSLVTQANDPSITLKPIDQLHWEVTPEGVAFAALEGERFNEAYLSMVKLPGGLTSPPHTKTANMFGIVLNGSMVHVPFDSQDPDKTFPEKILSAGDYYKIPKDLPHISKCVSEAECITFLYQDGKFDFLPVENPTVK